MTPKLMLRGAAMIAVLLALGHTLGNPWTPAHDEGSQAVIAAMKAHRLDAVGLDRTYFDFYVGFGWMLGVYLAGHAIIFWQLASVSNLLGAKLRPIVIVLCLESSCIALLGWKFLFWVPVAMSLAIAFCLGGSVAMMRPKAPLVR